MIMPYGFNEDKSKYAIVAGTNMIAIGDSFNEGYTPDGNVTGWGERVKSMMQLDNNHFHNLYKGGAGMWKVSSKDNRSTFKVLLQDFAETYDDKSSISHIVVCGGRNDANSDHYADVFDATVDFITYARNTFPNAHVYIGHAGVGVESSAIQQNTTNSVLAYKDACDGKQRVTYLRGIETVLHNLSYLASDRMHANSSGQSRLATFIVNLIQNGITQSVYYPRLANSIITPSHGSTTAWNLYQTVNGDITNCDFNKVEFTFYDAPFEINASGTNAYELAEFAALPVLGNNIDHSLVNLSAIMRTTDGKYHNVPCGITLTGKMIKIIPFMCGEDGNGFFNETIDRIQLPSFSFKIGTVTGD